MGVPFSEEYQPDHPALGAGARVTLSARGEELRETLSATLCRTCHHRLGLHNATGLAVECMLPECGCPGFVGVA